MCDLDESAWREREAYREATRAAPPTVAPERSRPVPLDRSHRPTAIAAAA